MRVGIIGCGQLARMMALSGWAMRVDFAFLASAGEGTACVEGLGPVVSHCAGQTPGEVFHALGEPDVVTVERERVDLELLRGLTEFCAVYPNPDAVAACGDRFGEKRLLDSAGIASAPYRIAQSAQDVPAAATQLGLPVVVKNPTEGYDGKQQWHILDEQQLQAFTEQNPPGAWLVESRIAFEREISLIAARSPNGDVKVYPPTENRHHEGILITSVAPADGLEKRIAQTGEQNIRTLLETMNYVGVMAMECFVTADSLLVNELAPRVHNSGHWTMNGDVTSQFENHLRAILGLPLGATSGNQHYGMINLLGDYDHPELLAGLSADAHLHDYNKSPAPRRKRGHINVSSQDRDAVLSELARHHDKLYG